MLRTTSPRLLSPRSLSSRSLFGDGFFKDLDELFASHELFAAPQPGPRTVSTGRVNGYRTEDATHLVLEVPGVKAEDLSVQVLEGALQVDARRAELLPEGARLLRKELPEHFELHRRFTFAEDADLDAVEASLADGLLTLRIPRRNVAPRRIEIKVG